MMNMYYPTEYNNPQYETKEKPEMPVQRKRNKNSHSISSTAKQCKICGLINSNSWSLTIHMRRHNNERPAKCPHCPAAFVNNTELKSHVTTHTKEKRYKCRFCPKLFTNNSSKAFHEDVHGILQHKCKYCDEKFLSQVERRTHQRTHHQSDLSCRYCVKKFANAEFLRLHEQKHQSNLWNCKRCKLKFQSEDESQAHKLMHNASRSSNLPKKSNEVSYFQDSDVKLSAYFFTCGICCEKFSFRLDLAKHIEATHPSYEKESIYKFKCTVCNKSFDTKMKLRGHMIGHGPKKYKCQHCNYSSTRGKDLSKHIQGKHSTGKNFKCSQCGLLFTHYTTFISHKLKHGEKKFKCDMCDKAYYVKAQLSNHKRVSHYYGNPVCEQCGKLFRNIITLRSHQRRVHNRSQSLCLCNICGKSLYTNEIINHQQECFKMDVESRVPPKKNGPFCSTCNITFSMRKDLLSHVKEFHPSGIFSCHLCQKEYLLPEEVERHVERKHVTNKPILRKHKHLFTLEEKRNLKMNKVSYPCSDVYECFACGMAFPNEAEMNLHLADDVCIRPKSSQKSESHSYGEQYFAITKVLRSQSCAQILGDFEVHIIPKSFDLEPISLDCIPKSNEVSPIKEEKKTKKTKRSRPVFPPRMSIASYEQPMESKTRIPHHNRYTDILSANKREVLEAVALPEKADESETTIRLEIQNVLEDGEFYNLESVVVHDSKQIAETSKSSIPNNPQGGVVSSNDFLKMLQNKTVNVDGTPFVPLNELFEHLKVISGIELNSNTNNKF